jgi:hypothetical protein
MDDTRQSPVPIISGVTVIGPELLRDDDNISIEQQYLLISRFLRDQRQGISLPSRLKLERTSYSARTPCYH